MANIKTALLGFIFLFLVSPAWGENWVETTAVGREQSFYDSDSAYVDFATGLVIVEMAVKPPGEDDYNYLINGFDCSRWEFYMIGFKFSDGWKYDLYGEFEVQPVSEPTSPLAKTARWACDNYYSLPQDSLPFDFQLSK